LAKVAFGIQQGRGVGIGSPDYGPQSKSGVSHLKESPTPVVLSGLLCNFVAVYWLLCNLFYN